MFKIGLVILSSLLFLISCSKVDKFSYEPKNLDSNHICAEDYMIILNYNGPKAQILWKNGKISFYCEVREIFYEVLDIVQSKRIGAIYVQDFSNLKWGSYYDKWMKAEDAYYIIDSRKKGAMGVSYVPFNNKNEALKFQMDNGGKLILFKDINSEILNNSIITN